MIDGDARTHLTNGIQTAIVETLTPYGADSAVVSRETTDELVVFRVAPANPQSAPVTVTIGNNLAITLTFGHTSTQVVGPPEHIFDQLRVSLTAIFAGHFVETGPGHGRAELKLQTGERVILGAEKSPLSKRFGPKQRYQPYA